MHSLNGHLLGRYRLLQKIGSGGMATVYKAHDTVRNRIVAIKLLSPAMAQNAQFSQRFRREARVVMQLKHPNIMPVLDVGEQDGYAYIVMPYIRSGSLAERLQKGPLSPQEGARLVAQIAGALDYAHRQGVIHRDVKPSNILIDEKGNALLADFGLAHIQDTTMSLTGSALIGTPTYISPEQVRGEQVDARSDQYSLGIVLYQLITMKVPFEGDTPLAIVVKHVNEPLPMPSKINPNIPESMEHVILKASAKIPDDRFSSMAELNRAFQAALAHAVHPEANAPPKIQYRPTQPVDQVAADPDEPPPNPKRRLIQLGALAALLLLLLLACPVASTGVVGVLERFSSPVEGASMNDEQLTAMAATLDTFHTQEARPPTATPTHTAVPTELPDTATPILGVTATSLVVSPTLTATLTGTLTTTTPMATATLGLLPTWTPKPAPSSPIRYSSSPASRSSPLRSTRT